MVRVKLDQETLGLSSLMERVTQTRVKDCFQDVDTIYFVVAPGDLGKAIGKGGVNVKRVQNELGKRIKVIEYSDDLARFIRNIIYPLSIEKITIQENKVLLEDQSKKAKSLLIGREGKHLELINRAIQRFFNVEVVVH
ncbi:NusA-like transcription termination signal-binding factor [Candidatus Woesearchaeota archaeon]|nr:NusA-like transcription termination signal-binding factor [Candidatus Woesearchaeota archaeon]